MHVFLYIFGGVSLKNLISYSDKRSKDEKKILNLLIYRSDWVESKFVGFCSRLDFSHHQFTYFPLLIHIGRLHVRRGQVPGQPEELRQGQCARELSSRGPGLLERPRLQARARRQPVQGRCRPLLMGMWVCYMYLSNLH